jgi:tetratricopeptide (TPR) repeat protein
MLKQVILVFLLLFLIANFSYRIDLKRSPHELIGELMYFPSGLAVKALSLGFRAPIADLIWLRFIQYYGEHRMTDVRFDLMYHILDILTTLDPHFDHAYTIGALMLAHDAQRPDQARALLKKGMYANPETWRYPFVYGFIHYVFDVDYDVAATYFRLASRKPGAPEYTKRWAAFTLYKKIGDLESAFTIWMDIYGNSRDSVERGIARYYMDKIKMLRDIEYIEKKIGLFKEQTGRAPATLRELITAGLIKKIPKEPHGRNYEYILRNGKVSSSWQKEKN